MEERRKKRWRRRIVSRTLVVVVVSSGEVVVVLTAESWCRDGWRWKGRPRARQAVRGEGVGLPSERQNYHHPLYPRLRLHVFVC